MIRDGVAVRTVGMRILLKARIPNDTGNRAITEGRLPKVMEAFMADAKPEAAYFTLDGGDRCAYFFLDMTDAADMPKLAEAMFTELGASIDMTPAMSPEDLQRGLSSLG